MVFLLGNKRSVNIDFCGAFSECIHFGKMACLEKALRPVFSVSQKPVAFEHQRRKRIPLKLYRRKSRSRMSWS